MSESLVRIIKVDVTNATTVNDGQKELQDTLSLGFEMPTPPIVLSKTHILYTLVHPREKERIDFKTAYPSGKQLGYVKWAYGLSEKSLTEFKLSKHECSELIAHHKDVKDGKPCCKDDLKQALASVRGDAEYDGPDKPNANEYDDDLPF